MNRHTRIVPVLLAIASVAAVAGAQTTGIHISDGKSQSFVWTVTDGHGYRWDINHNGTVGDGTSDAYDGGMRIDVNNSSFSWGRNGQMNKAGDEVEVGPWQYGNLKISRRVYVDKKAGYCRWIDIFENSTASDQAVSIRYYTDMGGSILMSHTTSGKATVQEEDWGFVTGYRDSSSRPAVVHVFASKGAKVMPRVQFQRNSDNVYYYFNITVPANKAVALCFFEAQRRPFAKAKAFLKDFDVNAELRKVPSKLKRIILNMGNASMSVGRLELPRHETHDLAVLRNGDELLGTILNETFGIRGHLGQIDLPAERVLGLAVPAAEDDFVQLALTDGQILAGQLTSGPVRIKLQNGNEMALDGRKLATMSFRMSEEKPESLEISDPMVILRGGQQVIFNADDLDTSFHTEYGQFPLRPEQLSRVHLHTADGGLHRAVFRNGSVVSGLLMLDRFKVRLPELDATLQCPRGQADALAFPGQAVTDKKRAVITLRNDDKVIGFFLDEKITIGTQFGQVQLDPYRIASAEFMSGSLAQVSCKLHDGSTVSGKVLNAALRFQVDKGPELQVYPGHILEIAVPKDAARLNEPTTQPDSTEGDDTPETPEAGNAENTDGQAEDPSTSEAVAELTEQIKQLQAQIQQVDQERAKSTDVLASLRQTHKQLVNAGKPREAAEVEKRAKVVARNLAELSAKDDKLEAALQAVRKKLAEAKAAR